MNNILSYIHLQSRETLIENDNTWREITTFMPEVKYKQQIETQKYYANSYV
jgi:hypothetical protein